MQQVQQVLPASTVVAAAAVVVAVCEEQDVRVDPWNVVDAI